MYNKDLRQAGLKITLPRLKILEILETSEDHHLSAEGVYRKLIAEGAEIGLATVYRVLTQFEHAGLVIRHNFEEGHSIFELKRTEHHDHLVCVKCGKVDEFVDKVIEARQAAIAQKARYKMTDHSLTIYGLCSGCQQTQDDKNY